MSTSTTAGRVRSTPDEVHERILETADRLFYAEGVHAVGIDRIIAEAGVAKASLYGHFSTKSDLVAAYLRRRSQRSGERLREALGALPAGAARDRVLVIMEDLWAWLHEDTFRGCPFINATAEYADPDHPVRREVAAHRHAFVALLHEQVSDRPDADLLAAALALIYDETLVAAQVDGAVAAERTSRHLVGTLLDHNGVTQDVHVTRSGERA